MGAGLDPDKSVDFDIMDPQGLNALKLMKSLQTPINKTNPAKWAYERLAKCIEEFEGGLDGEQEVGARLVSFGSEVKFHISDMGYYGPDIITFHGYDGEGNQVQLIQHCSQLSVLLIALPKQNAEPRRIGFPLTARLDNSAEKE